MVKRIIQSGEKKLREVSKPVSKVDKKTIASKLCIDN